MADTAVLGASEKWLAEQWTSKLSAAIGSMMGDAPKIGDAAALEETPTGERVEWWEQPFSISPEAIMWVGAPAETGKAIGNEILKSAGIDDADEANIKSTYAEILSQSLGGMGQALSARFRGEVTCSAGREAATPPPACLPVSITLGEELRIYIAFSKALVDLCDKSLLARKAPAVSAAPVDIAAEEGSDSRGYPKGLDRLLDVELPLSVSFGHAELPIKDVIKLTTGSIVELNRSISEPVEVIVNNVVIARGEVVVVEGNFGIRIKEVISRQERLRTLK